MKGSGKAGNGKDRQCRLQRPIHQDDIRGGRQGNPHLAIHKPVTPLRPPSTFSRCFNRDGEGASA